MRLRRVRVGARTFVWRAEIRHVQGSGDCHRCVRVRAWGAGKTSQALEADLLSVAWPAPWGACATDGAYPTPDDVRTVISYALAHGWQPEVHGGTFVLSEREHACARCARSVGDSGGRRPPCAAKSAIALADPLHCTTNAVAVPRKMRTMSCFAAWRTRR